MKVLIVDDKVEDLVGAENAVRETLPDAEIITTEDEYYALEVVKKKKIDVVILDVILKHEHGYAMCQKVLSINPKILVIIMTKSINAIDTSLARKVGTHAFVVKTRDFANLKSALAVLPVLVA